MSYPTSLTLQIANQNRREDMIDMNENEKAALECGVELMGEYLESLEKTDLSEFTPEEFRMLAECGVTGYLNELGRLSNDANAKAI